MEAVGTALARFVLAIALAAIAAALLALFIREVRGAFALLRHSLAPLPAGDRALLERWSPFYRSLPPRGQKRFARRVKALLFEKEWIGRGIVVSQAMRIRISAAAAQVTFGFDRLLLLHFARIMVFPGDYLNKRSGRRHQGEVMPDRGTIVLSWTHFEEGEANPDDAHNVGLHEMAHALWFENSIGEGEDHFLEQGVLDQWKAVAVAEMAHIRAGKPHFLRSYAGTNEAEFFAVAVECFFEQAPAFNAAMPQAYSILARLLKQDPLRATREV